MLNADYFIIIFDLVNLEIWCALLCEQAKLILVELNGLSCIEEL
jgi:hypothetical protein